MCIRDRFYLYYDTELFKEKILDYVKKDEENIDKLYRNLQLVLGLTYLQVPFGAMKGIMQYNFRYIDEDVLGKAYETFLGEVRKEKGVYYTPKYITQYIVENTVGKVFDEVLAKIKEKLEKEHFEDAKELALRLTSIRVLDPACGSGSFLIKAIRIIVSKYEKLNQLIESAERNLRQRYSNFLSSLDIPQEVRAKLEMLSEIRKIIGPRNKRELISRVIVRHIHGVDLDKRALEVAKVNIWLEATKLAPKEFRYDRLPACTNHILPNLEMNLCHGNSLIGLPDSIIIEFLSKKYKKDVIKLSSLRQEYQDKPTDPELIEKIKEIKNIIREKLDEEFKKYLKTENLPLEIVDETKAFHWAMEFWFSFFDKNGKVLPKEQRGFDVVIGNPPWVHDMTENEKMYYTKAYRLFKIEPNTFQLFIEKSASLIQKSGLFGFIIPSMLRLKENYIPLRKFLIETTEILEIDDVGYAFDVQMPAMILIYRKNTPRSGGKTKLVYADYTSFLEGRFTCLYVPQEQFQKIDGYKFVFLSYDLINKLLEEKSTVPLGLLLDDKLSKRGVEIGTKGKVMKCPNCNKWSFFSTKKNRCPHCKYPISTSGVQSDFLIVSKPRPDLITLPLIMGEDIDRYFIKGFHYLKLGYEGIKYKLPVYDNERILVRETGNRITAALGPEKVATLRTIYNLKLNRDALKEVDPKYVLGILNSSLINFIYNNLFVTERGTFPKIRLVEVKKLPIRQITLEQQRAVAEYVDKIMLLKKVHHKFFELWKEWCTRLKNDELTLYEILSGDGRLMRSGDFKKAWTSKASFYPDEFELPKKVFNNFKIIGGSESNLIAIYGLDKNNKEELLFEMEFADRNLMLHTYCSLLKALSSRAKIETLHDLFIKTKIPIIKKVNASSNELTPNIIKKVKSEFKKWLEQNKINNVEADLTKIDNEIEDLEAKIDALVFKLYNLNEGEIKIVFNSLKTPTIYQGKVLRFFRKL